MSEEEEKKEEKQRFGIPKYYYWGKSPPKPKAPAYSATKLINGEQKRFYWVMTAFTIAKLAAIIAFFLLIFSRF